MRQSLETKDQKSKSQVLVGSGSCAAILNMFALLATAEMLRDHPRPKKAKIDEYLRLPRTTRSK